MCGVEMAVNKSQDKTPIKPEQAEDKYLQDGLILTAKEKREVRQLFRLKKFSTSKNKNRVTLYRKKDATSNETYKITVIKFKNPDTKKKEYFAIYPGPILGKGGNGKVSLMQNIKTKEWMALKAMNVSEETLAEREKEKNNLIQFGRSPGGHQSIQTHQGIVLVSQNNLDLNKLKQIQENNNGKPVLVKQNNKIMLYQFVKNNHKMQNINNAPFNNLHFPKDNNPILLKSKFLSKEMVKELKNKNAYRVTAKKSVYLLAMKLAQGKDLDKLFVSTYPSIEIYTNEMNYQSELDRAKQNNDKNFFKNIYFINIPTQPDKLQAIYFDNGVEKIKIVDKDVVFNEMKKTSHLSHFNQFPSNNATQSITFVENQKVYNNILKIAGLPPAQIVNQNAITVTEVALAMIEAIKELHQAGLIHRDIKPEQFIYNSSTKQIELIDLGSAVSIDRPRENIGNGTTPAYVAPEALIPAQLGLAYTTEQIMQKAYQKWKNGDFTKSVPTKTDYATFQAFHKAENNKKVNPVYVNEFLKIKSDMHHIDYTTAADYYSLAISIGLLYGQVERQYLNDTFNLSPPKYLKANQDSPAAYIYRIKNLEQAKQNNIQQLPEQELKKLNDMLIALMNTDPTKRPSLDQIEQFLKTLPQKLANQPVATHDTSDMIIPKNMPELPKAPVSNLADKQNKMNIPDVMPPLPTPPKQHSTAAIFTKISVTKEVINAPKVQEQLLKAKENMNKIKESTQAKSVNESKKDTSLDNDAPKPTSHRPLKAR